MHLKILINWKKKVKEQDDEMQKLKDMIKNQEKQKKEEAEGDAASKGG